MEAVHACAEQIRQHKSQTAISIDQQRHFFIQLSIGLCICMPENHQAMKHLFKQADNALYHAKR
ncbi:diguanylate cyclase domain-containing protein [Acinetobacter beijerinckii]|uniref:diguanylate cyclase domain-containing protein n=1 Tax=Acinetobacter beijerinckii TaxID=262668 RepID=UPI0024073707|nr:diguanylate cyclase [Acinetobacter beijerinckii]